MFTSDVIEKLERRTKAKPNFTCSGPKRKQPSELTFGLANDEMEASRYDRRTTTRRIKLIASTLWLVLLILGPDKIEAAGKKLLLEAKEEKLIAKQGN